MCPNENSKNSSGPLFNKSAQRNPFGLFEVTGIEMEYMIVDQSSLAVKPLCDVLMKEVSGRVVGSFDNGPIMWSNEIVNHVVELKTNGPVASLGSVVQAFQDNVLQINALLHKHQAVLMPSGAHPWMNPLLETKLWKYDTKEVYNLYNKIFGCHGHGWSNLQSTHINLPFGNDQEFGLLHAAIRVLLPILPALCASTPVMDGVLTGFSDTRLEKYRVNQQRIPSITGQVIPEAAFTQEMYHTRIFKPMLEEVAPFDPDKILDCHFLNSRGAIARFDRGAIEIRVIDIQECPLVDLAIAEAVNVILKMLIREVPFSTLSEWDEADLTPIFLDCVKWGEQTVLKNDQYLDLWGISERGVTAAYLWQHLQGKINHMMDPLLGKIFKQLVDNGTLSTRIIKYLNNDYSLNNLRETYQQLVQCLHDNKPFNVGG